MQSPQLDVADKRISSPVYITQYKKTDEVPDHQFRFLSNGRGENDSFMEELFSFGEKLKRKIQNSPFHWKGFGTLRFSSNELLFEPDNIELDGLQPVPAQKVLRENVQHNMLVGDQEMTSQQVTEVLNKVESKRPWFMVLGWIVLILAVIAIIILLYMKNFQTTSTGLQLRW
jgi:predicted nucleic acid-binding Zn ribbon protein